MFTPTESRPLIGKLFGFFALVVGCLGTVAALATLAYAAIVGPGSNSAAGAALLGAGSEGVILVGVPCAAYSLYCKRTKAGWIGLALCVVPFLTCFAAGALAGGGR
jgi:hypothetical protein